MEKIISSFEEMINIFVQEKQKVISMLLEINVAAKANIAESTRLKEIKANLDEREKGITDIENVIAIKQSAKETLAEAERIQLENDAKHEQIKEQLREISLAKQEIDNANILIKKENEAINKIREELSNEKANLKESVLKELVKKAK